MVICVHQFYKYRLVTRGLGLLSSGFSVAVWGLGLRS